MTRLRFYTPDGALLYERAVPAATGNDTLSFLGVSFNAGEVVGRVQIVTGNVALGLNEKVGANVVAMDDFIYAEPVATAGLTLTPGIDDAVPLGRDRPRHRARRRARRPDRRPVSVRRLRRDRGCFLGLPASGHPDRRRPTPSAAPSPRGLAARRRPRPAGGTAVRRRARGAATPSAGRWSPTPSRRAHPESRQA